MLGNPDYAPSPVHWGGQQFQDPGALSRWLIARGASPAIWAIRHPAAAAALGMPMPQGAPAAPPAQFVPGGFHGQGVPAPQAPGPMVGPGMPPPPTGTAPVGPLQPAIGSIGPVGPGVDPGIMGQMGDESQPGPMAMVPGVLDALRQPSSRVPSEGGRPHPVTVQGHKQPHYIFDLPGQLKQRGGAGSIDPGFSDIDPQLLDRLRSLMPPPRNIDPGWAAKPRINRRLRRGPHQRGARPRKIGGR